MILNLIRNLGISEFYIFITKIELLNTLSKEINLFLFYKKYLSYNSNSSLQYINITF